jgi:hypothetical protein
MEIDIAWKLQVAPSLRSYAPCFTVHQISVFISEDLFFELVIDKNISSNISSEDYFQQYILRE